MKKIIVLVLSLVVLSLSCSVAYGLDFDCLYPSCGVVVEVNYADDYIVIEDFTGNCWEWSGVEDWDNGDIVSMIMDDNNTEQIFDDSILAIRYNGVIED